MLVSIIFGTFLINSPYLAGQLGRFVPQLLEKNSEPVGGFVGLDEHEDGAEPETPDDVADDGRLDADVAPDKHLPQLGRRDEPVAADLLLGSIISFYPVVVSPGGGHVDLKMRTTIKMIIEK